MKALKYLSIFVSGIAAGATATYIFVVKPDRKRFDEEFKDQAQYYKDKYAPHKELEKRMKELKEEGEMIRETQEKLERLKTPYETYSSVETKEEYLASIESPKEDPHVYDITADDFINGAITYDKVSLRLYEGDGTVVNINYTSGDDDEETEVVIADDLIGIENLNRLMDGEEDGLYLRDDEKEVDYEIDKVEGCYTELTGEI